MGVNNYRRTLLATAALALAAAALAAPSTTAQSTDTAAEVREHLVGGWSLASRVTATLDGRVLVDPGLSATPKGVLIYDRSGHMAAQLSRPGRTVDMLGEECRIAEAVKGTADTSQTILGYDAYFGTYTVDVGNGVVTHHLESALFPGDVGKNIPRQFTLLGDTLTIRFQTTLQDRTKVVRTLVWTRLN